MTPLPTGSDQHTPASGKAGPSPALTRNRRPHPVGGRRAGAPAASRPDHTLSRNAAGGSGPAPAGVLPAVAAGRKSCHHPSRSAARPGRRRRPRSSPGSPSAPARRRAAVRPEPVAQAAGWLSGQLHRGPGAQRRSSTSTTSACPIDVALGLRRRRQEGRRRQAVTKAGRQERRALHRRIRRPAHLRRCHRQGRRRSRRRQRQEPARRSAASTWSPSSRAGGVGRTDRRTDRGRLRPDQRVRRRLRQRDRPGVRRPGARRGGQRRGRRGDRLPARSSSAPTGTSA